MSTKQHPKRDSSPDAFVAFWLLQSTRAGAIETQFAMTIWPLKWGRLYYSVARILINLTSKYLEKHFEIELANKSCTFSTLHGASFPSLGARML